MRITVNERPLDAEPNTTAFHLRDELKADADIVVVNGAPALQDVSLHEGDAVVLIARGEQPSRDELEALMAARHTPGVHAALKKATVGIAGLGGLGSAVAVALARIGVGTLVLVDFDVVEPSNLNRQQYFIEQLGLLKTEAIQANLDRINPYVKTVTHTTRISPDNVTELFEQVDVLVEAFDLAESKAMLLETAQTQLPHTPIVLATGLAGHATSNTIVTRRVRPNVYLVGDRTTAAAPGTGLMAPRVGVAAHHQANAVVQLLLNEDPSTA